jgi:hypothetical protein
MKAGAMNFDTGGNYRLTISREGYPDADEMDVQYDGQEHHDGEEVHYFAGPGRFHVGIPEHLIGSDFRIEPV